MRLQSHYCTRTITVAIILINTGCIIVLRLNSEPSITSASPGCYSFHPEVTSLPCFSDRRNMARNFTQRLYAFNDALSAIRYQTMAKRATNNSWSQAFFSGSTVKVVIAGNGENLMQRLSNFPLQTIYLPWIVSRNNQLQCVWDSADDNSNLLIQNYFDWIGEDALCDHVNSPENALKWESPLGTRKCRKNISEWDSPISLDPVYLKWQEINDNMSTLNNDTIMFHGSPYKIPDKSLLHLHIITDVIVTFAGDVFNGQFKLAACGCDCDLSNTVHSRWFGQPYYREVFVMSQQWGHQIFHGMLEHMPRVAPFVQFLTKNKLIKVHVWRTSGLLADHLELLGIERSRLVSGDIRAGIAYVTKATQCFQPDMVQTQLLSSLYRAYMQRNFPVEPQHRVIVIRRTGFSISGHYRHVVQQAEIEKLVELAARDYNLTYTVFSDNPVPSLNETMRLFHSAVLVVGVHGAGESNIVFSVPGVFIVEIACNPLLPESFCFKHIAQALGHRWHGVFGQGACRGAINVEPSKVEKAVKLSLKKWMLERRL
jgi:Glycosyltransferase 61